MKSLIKSILPLVMLALSFNAKSDVNIRISPFALFSGTYNLSADFPIAEAWTLGPTASFMKRETEGFDVSGYAYGLRGNYYFGGKVFEDSWYFGPSLTYTHVEVERDYGGTTGEVEGRANGIALTTLFGYQWFRKSFNFGIGIGPRYASLSEIKVKNPQNNVSETYDGSSGFGLDGEITVGWKF